MKMIDKNGMPTEVLLVEDSPGDVRLTQEAFRDANAGVHLHIATGGVEAMTFLKREGNRANAPRPDLILLDLNLPKMDGREVLAHITGNPALNTIPTIILTTPTPKPTSRKAIYSKRTAISRSPSNSTRLRL